MQAKTFAVFAALFIVFGILNLIRQQRMTFKFSVLWLGGSLFVLFLAFNDQLIATAARKAGFELTSNFIFFLFMCFFILVSLCLTLYINEQTTRTERLTQSLGLLEHRITNLEKKDTSNSREV